MRNRTCAHCVNDKTVKHINFDENGVCNFCRSYDEIKSKIHDYNNLEKLFLKKINPSGTYDYDCAVGFSGGKDSTYVLYKLVKEYGLKVKAFTLDNGFMSKEARTKIDKIVNELNVEHEYVTCDMSILKKMHHVIVKKYLSPCIACAFLGYAVMINYASKINAKTCIHGRSFYQMFRAYATDTQDVFKPFIESGLKEEVNLEELYKEIISKIDSLVDKKLAKEIKEDLLSDAINKGYREFVAYFLYHPYNKDEIIDFLTKNTSWTVDSEEEHFDCEIHHGALYLKNMMARRNHLMPEISVMIREGIISKEEGEKMLNTSVDKKLAKEELKKLCKYADINYSTLMLKAFIYSKRWW